MIYMLHCGMRKGQQGYWSYEIKNDESNANKYAIRTSGSNTYGKVSLLVGVANQAQGEEFAFSRLTIIVDEQTYASTLVDNYVTPLNNGDADVDDVKCGATYGATLIKEMIDETKTIADSRKGM